MEGALVVWIWVLIGKAGLPAEQCQALCDGPLENALAGTFIASERRAIHKNDTLVRFNMKSVTLVTDYGQNTTLCAQL